MSDDVQKVWCEKCQSFIYTSLVKYEVKAMGLGIAIVRRERYDCPNCGIVHKLISTSCALAQPQRRIA
jgi:hypothetical protein